MSPLRLPLPRHDLPVLLDRRRASTRTESIRNQGPLAFPELGDGLSQSIFFILRPARGRPAFRLLTIFLPDSQQGVRVLGLVFFRHCGAIALPLPGHDLPVLFHAGSRSARPEFLGDLLPASFGAVLLDLRGASNGLKIEK